MKPEQKEKLEKLVVKVDEVKKKVDQEVQNKVMPMLKGNEGVAVVVLAVMLIASISLKSVIFGLIAAGVMLLPAYAPKLMAKLSQGKKEEQKPEAPVVEPEDKKE